MKWKNDLIVRMSIAKCLNRAHVRVYFVLMKSFDQHWSMIFDEKEEMFEQAVILISSVVKKT